VIVNLLNTEEIIDIAISFSLKHCFKQQGLAYLRFLKPVFIHQVP